MIAPFVAAARVVEERIRSSRTLRVLARSSLVVLARVSPEFRDYVRIRVRRVV